MHKIKQEMLGDREKAFSNLYKNCLPNICRWVQRMGGTVEDGKDIFQDSLIVYYEKVLNGQLESFTNQQAYILGIAKKLWLKKYHHMKKLVELNAMEKNISIPIDFYAQNKKQNRMIHFLETAGKRCMEILQSFYYHQTPLPEIAQRFGFSNTRSATVQKYKCLEKIRTQVKTKQMSYEEIME